MISAAASDSGSDTPSNMQWQSKEAAKAKDRIGYSTLPSVLLRAYHAKRAEKDAKGADLQFLHNSHIFQAVEFESY